MQIDAGAVDDIAARWFAGRTSQPGLAYGVVADGDLVHSGGLGERRAGGPAPDADTVFRIASMTKSFTAAVVLLLRDTGALALDDPAADYVPELTGLRLPSSDCPRVTIRHLLTMTAGFPADDPWGDRQHLAAIARGYRHDSSGDGWLELPLDPHGAFAPMGGVFSCVRDLARWVAGFARYCASCGLLARGPGPASSTATWRVMGAPPPRSG
jgi:CubicO group peptidase (beta-lactamase class C family)